MISSLILVALSFTISVYGSHFNIIVNITDNDLNAVYNCSLDANAHSNILTDCVSSKNISLARDIDSSVGDQSIKNVRCRWAQKMK